MEATGHQEINVALLFIELGLMVLGLGILARFASRFGFSPIPLYLLAGLAFGTGGLVPLRFGEDFVRIAAEVGVVLLLFMLGLEYTGERLVRTLRTGYSIGLRDILLNFTPGLAAGFLLGMSPLAAVMVGGITYVSSSGMIAKILSERERLKGAEAPLIVSILVLEDLAMAVFLPVIGVLLTGRGLLEGTLAVAIALLTVVGVLFFAIRYSRRISSIVSHQLDEIVVLSIIGLVLLVAGIAQELQVSAAIGAFLVGVAMSAPVSERAKLLIGPLRDLFAATFFLFFSLQIDPTGLLPWLGIALLLAVVTALTKIGTGLWAGSATGLTKRESMRAGVTLILRGEFSIVLAGLGTTLEPRLAPLAAAYVLILAAMGPLLARFVRRSRIDDGLGLDVSHR